jgi:amidohydrolase
MNVKDVKESARKALEEQREQLVGLSRRIHATPELGFEEEKASEWVAQFLSDSSFVVEKPAYGMPTAFAARAGGGPLRIVICAEYDSLPGIGHACGHNLIAAMSAGAAVAIARVADDVGLTVTVLGSPAEEIGDGGGKILLLERGAFAEAHAAMMAHPGPFDLVRPKIIASSMFDVRYTGKEAHAAAFPELGINAADALTIAQTSIGLLRQHIHPSNRIHGIVTHGGDAPNIVPGRTTARYMIRSETLAELDVLRPRVHNCFEAGAIGSGARLEILGGDRPYAHMIHDLELASLYEANARELGRTFPDPGPIGERFAASTDMGNVSLALPSIHPLISIESLPAVNHQPEFAAHCVTAAAERAIFDGGLALAWTAIDMARDKNICERLMNRRNSR